MSDTTHAGDDEDWKASTIHTKGEYWKSLWEGLGIVLLSAGGLALSAYCILGALDVIANADGLFALLGGTAALLFMGALGFGFIGLFGISLLAIPVLAKEGVVLLVQRFSK